MADSVRHGDRQPIQRSNARRTNQSKLHTCGPVARSPPAHPPGPQPSPTAGNQAEKFGYPQRNLPACGRTTSAQTRCPDIEPQALMSGWARSSPPIAGSPARNPLACQPWRRDQATGSDGKSGRRGPTVVNAVGAIAALLVGRTTDGPRADPTHGCPVTGLNR